MSCRGLFITGTDTDVGKTYISRLIVRQLLAQGLAVGAYKPVCSGAQFRADGSPCWTDIEALHEALEGRFLREKIGPQTFLAPLAPPRAAELEVRSVDESLLQTGRQWWQSEVTHLLIEGAGGLLSPISSRLSVADLAVEAGFPLLIVAHAGLGTLNHTLLTLEAAERRGVKVAGIVLNQTAQQASTEDVSWIYNAEDLQQRTSVPVLGLLRYQAEQLLNCKGEETLMNWAERFDICATDR